MQLWDIYHDHIPSFLQEAAQTAPMVRLQGVGMNCGCEYTALPLFAGLKPYSRFDHSMGVALIVWHFTGDRAQALSGLLHDISTPVFAHVVDFLRGDHMTQESTEDGTGQMIRQSGEIGRLLNTLKLHPEDVEDYHRYPIADNDSPQLSADRLEYTLGNAVNYGLLPRPEVQRLYSGLTVGANEHSQPELMFTRPDDALAFARTALKCSRIYVSDPDRYAMQILAELLAEAIRLNLLSEEDLYLQEADVIAKLEASPLLPRWQAFCALSGIERAEQSMGGDWRLIRAKKRCIDPFVDGRGRVSQLFPEFGVELDAFRCCSQEYWLRGK